MRAVAQLIGGFHYHTIIKTIKQLNSRIKEIRKDQYLNSFAKIQVCATFCAGVIQRNVLIELNAI